jgi:hypothetical protein
MSDGPEGGGVQEVDGSDGLVGCGEQLCEAARGLNGTCGVCQHGWHGACCAVEGCDGCKKTAANYYFGG